MQHMDKQARIDLYFGTFPVQFSVVDGETKFYASGSVKVGTEEIHKKQSTARLGQLTDYGDEYKELRMEVVPSYDVVYTEPNTSNWPEVVSKPLLKTADGTVKGIRSGGRSALIIDENDKEENEVIIYRLKGCGNYVDDDGFRFPHPGFPIKDIELFGTKIGVEIRGCCFDYTALRELYFSDKIEQLLANNYYNMHLGNISVGYWKYTLNDVQFPKIDRCCAVFKTKGEKRLATHLLNGLEQLLSLIVPDSTDGLASVIDCFPEERTVKNEDGSISVLQTFRAVSRQAKIIDILDKKIALTVPSTIPSQIDEKWHNIWNQCCDSIKEYVSNSDNDTIGNLLALLYLRIGLESGFFVKLLHDNNINWGYFFDHNPVEPHCNAHPNNFIVLSPPSSFDEHNYQPILAPCDLDIAFTKDTFFNPMADTPNYLEYDDDLFKSWIETEEKEMAMSLGGETGMNSGLINNTGAKLSKLQETYSWALRDTMVSGYFAAKSGKHDDRIKKTTCAMHKAMHAIITMSLMFSANCAS